MDKLNMKTKDKTQDNFENLAKLFPNAVTETIDEVTGEVVRAIDKDVLAQEINEAVVEGREERYQFTWPDKKKAIIKANEGIDKTLRPCREESVDFDNTENLYIEGDNLEVLKLLRENYLGKVKMIYIDPPYNTGHDFIYKDKFSIEKQKFLEDSGQLDEEGNRLIANTESNGRFHTDWLNMMYPRLKVARDLLTDDGVIFISIDDNEQENLKKICDEVFGADNCLSILCVEISKTQGMKVRVAQQGGIVKNHEYILVYQKDVSIQAKRTVLFDKAEVWDNHFNCIISNNDGKYIKYGISEYIKIYFPDIYGLFRKYNLLNNDMISAKNIAKGILIDSNIKNFLYSQISDIIFQEMACNISVPIDIKKQLEHIDVVKYKEYLLTMSSGGKLRQYRNLRETLNVNDEYLSDYTRTTIRGALWKGFYSDMMNITKEGDIEFKNGKKPLRLIRQLIKWCGLKDDIVLDFFSGSATTAHAVMQLNAERSLEQVKDSGNERERERERESSGLKYIMVQLPEPTAEKSEAYKAGYKNICEIGKERIRRAAKKIKEDNPGCSFDGGFRVLKCDSTNMKDVFYTPEQYQPSLFAELEDNIKPDRSSEDLLFQVMLELGISLSCKIEEIEIADKCVMCVNENYLIACFDRNITDDVIEAIAKKKPSYFVMRDSSLANDSVATNFEQIFKAHSPETIRKVL